MEKQDKFYYIGLAIVMIAGIFGTYVALTYVPKEQELEVQDSVEGTGEEVVTGDTVKVHYTGTLEDGTVFDSNTEENGAEPFQFTVGNGEVIQGWEQGILGMKVGGKRTLTVPSDLAYGDDDYNNIPGGSTLIFEIELVEIVTDTVEEITEETAE